MTNRLSLCAAAAWFVVCVAPAFAEPRLIVHPAQLEFAGRRDPQRVLVTLADEGTPPRDVTAEAAFSSLAEGVVTVAPSGLCTPAGPGEAQIEVSVGGLTALVPVKVGALQGELAPSFNEDVLPVLTRLGCNQGACHGKLAGQQGFRLSLRGYAPEWDHEWIVREFQGRRVNLLQPEESLLLRKATGETPHGGGKLMSRESREYQTFVDWLAAGAPAPLAEEPTVERLELLPGPQQMQPGQRQQLVLRAHYTDGHVRDATWPAKFFTNDASVLDVTTAGQATALRPGETSIRAHFQGLVAVTLVTIPFEQAPPSQFYAERRGTVDEHVFNKLAALKIPPSGEASDATFMRRVYLDLIGALPTPEEARAFLADQSPDKRTKLIDALLERSEFVDFWTLQLADLFQNRKERDHDVRGAKGVRSFHAWLRGQVAANRPWNELVRDVLTSSGDSSASPALGYYIVTVGENREAEKSEIVDSVAQAFLGTRIGCAKCHNHPLERYTQDDYYHFAAYFSRMKFERAGAPGETTKMTVSHPDPNRNKEAVGAHQPRTGRMMAPQPLDRTATPVEPGDDPRVKLVDWMTNPNNEAFAGAMINRLWRHFMGVGLVEPVDDLRASNPPTNPELWNCLAQEFIRSGYNLKHVMRLIVSSRAYQLDSATVAGNETDERFYSHYYARRLSAEVMLDALADASGTPNSFTGYPLGARATQVPDPSLDSYFLRLFGRSDRTTACACERKGDVTISQLLHLQNGETIVQKLHNGDGRLAKLLAQSVAPENIVDELFLACRSRLPSPDERTAVQAALASGDPAPEVLRDLFWALLNSKEFAFNY